jgi:hypothetical protein
MSALPSLSSQPIFTLQVECPTHVWIVNAAHELPGYHQIIILPSSNSSGPTIAAYYRMIDSEYNLKTHIFLGAVPFKYLFDDFLKIVMPPFPHPASPLPSPQQHMLLLPINDVEINKVRQTQPNLLHPIFKLPNYVQEEVLPVKICLSTTLRLVAPEDQLREAALQYASPPYQVIGSLGMNSNPDEEILLLKSRRLPPNHDYHYVELIVHPSHVDEDIGFVLSDEARWRTSIRVKAEEWHQWHPELDLVTKLWCEELLYMKQVVHLRKQTED